MTADLTGDVPGRHRGGRWFRRVTAASAVGASLSGLLWFIRELGVMVPVAGPYTGLVLPCFGVVLWLAVVVCLEVAPLAWTPGQVWVARRWWWLSLPLVVAAASGAFVLGADHRGGEPGLALPAVASPLVLLGLTVVLARRTVAAQHSESGPVRTAGQAVVDVVAALLLPLLLAWLALCGFFLTMVVPRDVTVVPEAGRESTVLVEHLTNVGGRYTREWVQRGLVYVDP